jgi:hypothetical protein
MGSATALEKIDRIAGDGTIREHVWNGTRTLCGLAVAQHQPPAGNAPCGNCVHIAARADAVRRTDQKPSLLAHVPPPHPATLPAPLTDQQGRALHASWQGDRWCGLGQHEIACDVRADLVTLGYLRPMYGVENKLIGFEFEMDRDDQGLYALARWQGDSFPVQHLPISVRAANVFQNQQIVTVGDLAARSVFDLVRLKHFGRKTLKETQEVLARLGRSLSQTNMKRRPAAVAAPAPVTVMHQGFPCGTIAASTRSWRDGEGAADVNRVGGWSRAREPLEALVKSLEGRIALNLGTGGHHPDPALRAAARHPDASVRIAALVRVDAYWLALDDVKRTLSLLYPESDHGDPT